MSDTLARVLAIGAVAFLCGLAIFHATPEGLGTFITVAASGAILTILTKLAISN